MLRLFSETPSNIMSDGARKFKKAEADAHEYFLGLIDG